MRSGVGVRNRLADEFDTISDEPAQLAPYIVTMTESQARALFEILCEAGVHHIRDTHNPDLVLVWNNNETDQIMYRYSDVYLHFGNVHPFDQHAGVAPRFAAFKPVGSSASVSLLPNSNHTHAAMPSTSHGCVVGRRCFVNAVILSGWL